MNTNAQLEDLIIRHALRRWDVARLLGKPLNSAGGYSNSTVDRWLSGANQVSEIALELLAMKLEGREEQPDPWQRLILYRARVSSSGVSLLGRLGGIPSQAGVVGGLGISCAISGLPAQ